MIHVTCAIIENNGKVLCAQRSEFMTLPLKWEFPGGKVENGESLEACLCREIREELGLEIVIIEKLPPGKHVYANDKPILLFPFRCRISGGDILLREHKQVKWLAPKKLKKLDWADADIQSSITIWQAVRDTEAAPEKCNIQ